MEIKDAFKNFERPEFPFRCKRQVVIASREAVKSRNSSAQSFSRFFANAVVSMKRKVFFVCSPTSTYTLIRVGVLCILSIVMAKATVGRRKGVLRCTCRGKHPQTVLPKKKNCSKKCGSTDKNHSLCRVGYAYQLPCTWQESGRQLYAQRSHPVKNFLNSLTSRCEVI